MPNAAEAERDKLLGAQNRAAWAESHIQDVEAQRDAALADVQGLTEQNAKLKERARLCRSPGRESLGDAEQGRSPAKDAENQLVGSRQVAEAAKLRGDKLKAENDALKSQPITAVVDKEETRRQAKEMADAMNAELQAKLDAVTGDAEQDVRNAYDSVLLASRSMLNTWQMVKPQFCKLPQEQREAVANQLIRTLGQIQGRYHNVCKDHGAGSRERQAHQGRCAHPVAHRAHPRGRQQQSGQDQRAGRASVGAGRGALPPHCRTAGRGGRPCSPQGHTVQRRGGVAQGAKMPA